MQTMKQLIIPEITFKDHIMSSAMSSFVSASTFYQTLEKWAILTFTKIA